MRKLLIFSAVLFLVTPFFGAFAENQTGFRRDGSEWFLIKNIEINIPENIPEDKFAVRVSTSSPSSRKIEFKHSGNKPLYLPIVDGKDSIRNTDINYDLDTESGNERNKVSGLTKKEYRKNNDIPDVLQYPMVPKFKVVNNQSYVLQKNIPGKNTFVQRKNKPWAEMTMLEFFTDELKKVMKFGDDRPSSVEAPETREFESKKIVYENEVHRISATIDFQLNENYISNAQEAYKDLDAGNMPVDTQPLWVEILSEIVGSLENMWERLF